MKSILSALIGATLACGAIEASADEATAQQVQLDIVQQSLTDALNAWAEQTGFQLVCLAPDVADAFVAPSLKGAYTAQGALEQLLAGTPLVYEFVNARTVTVRVRFQPASARFDVGSTGLRLRLAKLRSSGEAEVAAGSGGQLNEDSAFAQRKAVDGKGIQELEEIVVTGTHIRGNNNPTSTVFVHSRQDIKDSGAGSVSEFVATIPQNFTNDSRGTYFFGNSNNVQGATSVNLRGVGAEGTLVLLNGRRLAPGVLGQFVDVSFLPLASIDRVDVMTDGASAIYGSDAVAGVVNFVLRRDYEGAETRVRNSWLADSNAQQSSIAQTIGRSWHSGNALLAVDYHDDDALSAADRSYSQVPLPYFLEPSNRGYSLLGSSRQNIGEHTSVSFDGVYSDTKVTQVNTLETLPTLNSVAEGTQYSVGVSLDSNLSNGWSAEAAASVAANSLDRTLTGSTVGSEFYKAEVSTIDLKLDGPLVTFPAGVVAGAFGISGRREEYEDRSLSVDLFGPGAFRREVGAIFTELYIPLQGGNQYIAEDRFAASLAARYERYSDAGDTFDPKVGLVWRPLTGLKLHGSYATSFNTARYFETVTSSNGVIVETVLSDACASGTCLVVSDFGKKEEYKPEKSRSYTIGVEFRRQVSSAELAMTADYYRIRYKDRIGTPPFPDQIVANRGEFSQIVVEQPSLDFINTILSNAAGLALGVINLTGPFDPADVDFYVDQRATNLATTNTSGVDLQLVVSIESPRGIWQVGVSGNHIFEIENQLTKISPVFDVVDTLGNATQTRLRGRLAFSNDRLMVNGFVNYANSYINDRATPNARIGSWTTVDLTSRLSLEGWLGSFGSGMDVALNIRNVFNRAPPRTLVPGFTIGFDPTNSNAQGRVVAVELTKQWGR